MIALIFDLVSHIDSFSLFFATTPIPYYSSTCWHSPIGKCLFFNLNFIF